MQGLLTTSFDRYARYSYIWKLRQAWFGSAPLRVLDVGDPYGTLASVLGGDRTVSVDLFSEGAPATGSHSHVLGSGFALPFADATFDLVASHDTFEHLPVDGRLPFVEELLRGGRGPVLLVAPSADPRTERCEQVVNAYYVARTGSTLPPLDEHADGGLPDLAWLVGWLEEQGVAHRVHSDGWLYHWLAFMLLKAHFVAEGDPELDRAVDAAFNTLLRERDLAPPHYRRAVVLRPVAGEGVDLPEVAPPGGDVEADRSALTALGWELVAALPAGSVPTIPGSPLRRWVDDHRAGEGALAELARSLDIVLTAAHELQATVLVPCRHPAVPALPEVAVLVVDRGSPDHLRACIEAVRAQRYPKELVDVVVLGAGPDVDHHPGVRRVTGPEGADPVTLLNLAVADVGADCVAFLDSDVEVGPDWLAELVAAYDPAGGVLCVGSRLGGGGGSVGAAEALFAPRSAMLVERNLYRNVGGFDGEFLGVLDDADFGWRLWVLGYRVMVAGCPVRALVGGGEDRRELVERNALLSMVKNYDERNLRTVLAPVLLLLAEQAVSTGGDAPLTAVQAMAGVAAGLDAALEARQRVQVLRRRRDEEILGRFGRPFQEVVGSLASSGGDRLFAAFGAGAPGPPEGTARVLVVVGNAGPHGAARRPLGLASGLASVAEVVVAAPAGREGLPTAAVSVYRSGAELARLADEADVVVVDEAALRATPALLPTGALLVVDLAHRTLLGPATRTELADVLARGDAFLCATEPQRDGWLALLADAGRVGPVTGGDPSLRSLLDVVPDAAGGRPAPAEAALPGDAEGDRLVVSWADGSGEVAAALQAFAAVTPATPGAHLCLVVDGDAVAAAQLAATLAPAASCEVLDRRELPVDALDSLLRRAAVALAVGTDRADARLATASPVGHYLAAGTPVVCSAADPLAALVQAEGAGVVVPPEDVGAVRRALVRLLTDPFLRAASASAARRAGERLSWQAATAPLRRMVLAPWRHQRRGLASPTTAVPSTAAAGGDDHDGPGHELRAVLARLEALETLLQQQQAELGAARSTPAARAALWLRQRAQGR